MINGRFVNIRKTNEKRSIIIPNITNRRIVKNEGPDFYPTPEWGTKALLACESIEGTIWEPACGNGSMSKVLETLQHPVYSSDLNSHGYGVSGENFLTSHKTFDNIVTNPPFNIAEEFVEVGLKLANKKLILLLRLAFLESVGRYKSIFSVNPPARVWVFSQRLSMYPEGAPVQGGGTTSYGWFVFDKEVPISQGCQLRWIPPGFKTSTIKRTSKILEKKVDDDLPKLSK